jgi:hypothetical protein
VYVDVNACLAACRACLQQPLTSWGLRCLKAAKKQQPRHLAATGVEKGAGISLQAGFYALAAQYVWRRPLGKACPVVFPWCFSAMALHKR